MSPKEVKASRTALHEAGHIVIGLLHGLKLAGFCREFVHEDGTSGAYCCWEKLPQGDLSIGLFLPHGLTLVAGDVVQDKWAGRDGGDVGSLTDIGSFTILLGRTGYSDREEEIRRKCVLAVKDLLHEPQIQTAIRLVAEKWQSEDFDIKWATETVMGIVGPVRSLTLDGLRDLKDDEYYPSLTSR